MGVLLDDLDGDGDLDLVRAGGQLAVMLADGTGGFGSPTTVYSHPTLSVNTVAADDVTGDGRLDIVDFNSGPTGVEVCRNQTYASSEPLAYLGHVLDYYDGSEHVVPIHVAAGDPVPGQAVSLSLQNITGPYGLPIRPKGTSVLHNPASRSPLLCESPQ